MTTRVHDDTPCLLGEGPLWHPGRRELLWFDILGRRLHGAGRTWTMEDMTSAMAWIDQDTVLVARRGALLRLDLATGGEETVAPLDAENPVTRSNDGRVDPWGGFWVGTMGLRAERGAGAIWRLHRGELRKVFDRVTIPNSICFHPDRSHMLWSDTEERLVWRQPLDPGDGSPRGSPPSSSTSGPRA